MSRPHVIVAGAGIGGLTTALALLRAGIDVDVYEQAPELNELGAGVQVSANGTRVLYGLGLADALERTGTASTGKEVRLWNTGQTWPLVDLGETSVQRYGFPYLTLHRADFQNVLAEAVRAEKPNAIHLGARCEGAIEDENGAALLLAGAERIAGDVVIGADGIHSRVRQSLFGEDRAEFTGCMVWRGLLPRERVSPRYRSGGVLWVGPGAHIMQYPVRGGELFNFFGLVERTDWKSDRWNERGTIEECAADYRGWHADVQEMIAGIVVPFKWALILREPLLRWSVGRVTLLGDACHSTLPLLAQGANMAIEDAALVSRCILEWPDDIEAALRVYEAARLPRANKVVRVSAAQLAGFNSRSLANAAEAEAHIAREFTVERVEERYTWLYAYDATTVPIAHTDVLQPELV